MISLPLLLISRKLISDMNFIEYLLTYMIGMAIGVLIALIVINGKFISIQELNKCGYDYKEYSMVINGDSTNWVEIIKR